MWSVGLSFGIAATAVFPEVMTKHVVVSGIVYLDQLQRSVPVVKIFGLQPKPVYPEAKSP